MNNDPEWLIRTVVGFSKESEEFESEVRINNLSTWDLQKIFGMPCTEPMIECYEISEEKGKKIQQHESIVLDFERVDYFLESSTTDLEKAKNEGGFMGLIPPPMSFPTAMPDLTPSKPKD